MLNVTPDSFSDGGQFLSIENAVRHAIQLEKDGADVLDIGAESTRPGAEPVSLQEELNRLLPVILAVKKEVKIPISVDTVKSTVAEAALDQGAHIINDVSGLSDPEMIQIIADAKGGLVLMHNRGSPQTMNQFSEYQDLIPEIQNELQKKFQLAQEGGIHPDFIALDPGIGFAKKKDQNWTILNNLKSMREFLHRPFLIGVSRKSFLGGDVSERGPATLKAELEARNQGVEMIRTHDVAALRNTLKDSETIAEESLEKSSAD